jgi:tRNA threonylcarbamoyladenosine biosynthesis protein TsaB
VLLSVETSSSYGGLSIFKEKELIAETHWGPEQSHSETLTEAFAELLKTANLSSNLITEVLCSYGPGSFTGLRVGLNFAKSICYVNQIQLSLSPSFRSYLDLKNIEILKSSKNLVLLNAFKQQVFSCEYIFTGSGLMENINLTTFTPEEISIKYAADPKLVALGEGFSVYKNNFSEEFNSKLIFPNQQNENLSIQQAHVFFSYDHCLKFEKIDPLLAQPLYIKKSEAEENLNRGQLKKHTQRKL